jgi:general secretion pathway protein L
MLAELISWWTEQMRELVAPLSRHFSRLSGDVLSLECGAGAAGPWRVVRRRNGGNVPIATIPADAPSSVWRDAFASRGRAERVVITLAQRFLIRRTSLPMAAAGEIEALLRYEMDRLTPFQADAVLFAHRVVSRDSKAGKLLVDVAILPKAWIDTVVARLAVASIRPDAVEEAADASRVGSLPNGAASWRIAMDRTDSARHARTRLAWRMASATCAALALAMVAVPYIRQSLALAAVEQRISSLRSGMDRVTELHRQIASASEGAGQIASARQRGTVALRVLADVTDLLPDDTWLTSLSLRRARVVIEGHSAAATRLIAAMAADPQLNNPSFAAPVVRSEDGTDLFTIQAGFGS